MRDYVREFLEIVRALPGFLGERLIALAEEIEQAEVERKELRDAVRRNAEEAS